MSKKIIFSKEQIDMTQELLDQQMPLNKIGALFNTSGQTISRIIRENGLHRMITNSEIMQRRLPGYQQLEQNVCDYYQNNKITMTEVGEKYGLGICCIENILKRHGIQRLQPSDFIRKYSVDEDYFKDIDTDSKAYILGFLYADGNVGKNDYRLQISLQEDDKEILDKMKNEFQSNRPLQFINTPDNYPNRKPQYTLVVENKEFHKWLLYQGLIPNKSYIATFPKHLQEKYYKSFIRGLYDGDGCLYHNKKQNSNTISFTGTSELINCIGDIIEQELGIKKRIHKAQNSIKEDKNTRVLMFGGNKQVLKFLNWLYDGATIYLQRKYNKYCELYSINNSLIA